jgi:phosphoribosyl-AMP cyclohydrolase
MSNLSKFFEKSDLIPVIAQDAVTGEVLMLGYANEDALRRTLTTKTAWFWSRSRNELWNKGETSGNYLHVLEVYGDCDKDTVLLKCRPDGPTCHTGETSCFFNKVEGLRD